MQAVQERVDHPDDCQSLTSTDDGHASGSDKRFGYAAVPALIGGFAAAATGGLALLPAAGIGIAVAIGYGLMAEHNRPS